jgi:hypothetical protein
LQGYYKKNLKLRLVRLRTVSECRLSVKVIDQFLLAKRRIQTRYYKSSIWLNQKVC